MTRRTQRKGRATATVKRCVRPGCGFTAASWAACERHRDETGHGTFDVLDGAP